MAQRPRGLRAVGYRLADALELPKEVYFDLPRVVVIGNLQVSVENHRGLLAYDGNTVVLGLHAGKLIVAGESLVIGTVGAAQITVAGRLESLRFVTDDRPRAGGP